METENMTVQERIDAHFSKVEKVNIQNIVERMIESSGDKPNYLHMLLTVMEAAEVGKKYGPDDAIRAIRKIRRDMENRYGLKPSSDLLDKHEKLILCYIDYEEKFLK